MHFKLVFKREEKKIFVKKMIGVFQCCVLMGVLTSGISKSWRQIWSYLSKLCTIPSTDYAHRFNLFGYNKNGYDQVWSFLKWSFSFLIISFGLIVSKKNNSKIIFGISLKTSGVLDLGKSSDIWNRTETLTRKILDSSVQLSYENDNPNSKVL